MKIFIWVSAFFAVVMIRLLCQWNGILLGALPSMALFGGAWWLAQTLSSAWDDRKRSKQLWKEKQERDANRNFFTGKGTQDE